MIIEIVTCLMYLKTMLYEACIVYAILIKEKKKSGQHQNEERGQGLDKYPWK